MTPEEGKLVTGKFIPMPGREVAGKDLLQKFHLTCQCKPCVNGAGCTERTEDVDARTADEAALNKQFADWRIIDDKAYCKHCVENCGKRC